MKLHQVMSLLANQVDFNIMLSVKGMQTAPSVKTCIECFSTAHFKGLNQVKSSCWIKLASAGISLKLPQKMSNLNLKSQGFKCIIFRVY